MTDQVRHSGSCLCEGVRFTISGPLGKALHCHCGTCRKAHAAAFRTRIGVPDARFELVDGHDLIRGYETSPGVERRFCSRCGTRLATWDAQRHEHGVPVALLDGDPTIEVVLHVFAGEAPAWAPITDAIPSLPDLPTEKTPRNAPAKDRAPTD